MLMPNSVRLAAATVALVSLLGASAIYLNWSRTGPGSTGAPTVAPTALQTPRPTSVARGILGWTTYESEVYGFGVDVPSDWSLTVPAKRSWQAGDTFPSDGLPFAEKLFSVEDENAQIGLFFWALPVGEADIETVERLSAWAESFCTDVDGLSCEEFTRQAVPLCANESGACKPAILVPTTTVQYAFVPNWGTLELFGPEFAKVRVIVVSREDTFPSSARYGGSVELLKSLLTRMSVWEQN
jgi:hypothetical protein